MLWLCAEKAFAQGMEESKWRIYNPHYLRVRKGGFTAVCYLFVVCFLLMYGRIYFGKMFIDDLRQKV